MSAPKSLQGHKDKKRPIIRSVWIAGDDEIAFEYERVLGKRNTLQGLHRAAPKDERIAADLHIAEKRLEEMEAIYRESALEFKFRSIGRVAFEKMVNLHPPTSEQKQEVLDAGGDPKQLGWNVHTFSVALTAACSVEPKMTPAEVQDLFDDPDWSGPEAADLFNCALTCNLERRKVNWDAVGNGSRGMNGSSQNSPTASPSESPTAIS